jgi:hypothetical protein
MFQPQQNTVFHVVATIVAMISVDAVLIATVVSYGKFNIGVF